MGRKSKTFDESSERSKRRKSEDMRATHSTSELAHATEMKLRSSGASAAARVLKDITINSPK